MQLEKMLGGQRKQAEDLQLQLDMLRQEKEQLDSKKKRLETQYESVAGRLASVTTGEANPAHKVRASHVHAHHSTPFLGMPAI